MENNIYKARLEQARSDLRRVEQERAARNARFEEEISTLKKIIDYFAPLAKEPRDNPATDINGFGLDGAVMQIFSEDREHEIAPKQVLRRLLDRGFNLGAYSNRMAYVHGALKRLSKKGYLYKNTMQDVGSTYRWANALPQPLLPRVAEIKKKA
jgi:hypothetical protein